MNEPIEVSVQYTENDFVRGMKYAASRSKSSLVSVLVMASVSIAGYVLVFAYFLKSEGPWNLNDVVTLGIGIAAAVALSYLLKDWNLSNDIALSKMYNKSPLLKEAYVIRFSDSGIRSTSHSLTNDIQWSAVVETAESDDDVFFFLGPQQPVFVPKRVFSSVQLRDLRELTRRMLGSKDKFLQNIHR